MIVQCTLRNKIILIIISRCYSISETSFKRFIVSFNDNYEASIKIKYLGEIRTFMQNCWRFFCSKIEIGSEVGRHSQILSRKHQIRLDSMMRSDGSFGESDEQTQSCLIEAHLLSFRAEMENTLPDGKEKSWGYSNIFCGKQNIL